MRVPERSGYVLTHRFHPYPGRFHHHLARSLLGALSPSGAGVCDPFMGGGTTLVEAMLAGLPAVGSDLNPIAVLVARERTRIRTPAQAHGANEAARRIAARVEALRREKNSQRAPLAHLARLAPAYQPHLLAELAQWIRLINQTRAGPERETLRAVFSSGAVKFSNRPSDSNPGAAPPRYPKGAVSRFFVAKCEELVREQIVLGQRVPRPPRVRVLQEDARLLPSVGWGACEAILASPPYPGTYDYLDQHMLRMDWLELDSDPLAAGEIGARRREGGAAWGAAMRDALSTMARILQPQGRLHLVLGDWMEGTHPVDAGFALRRLAQTKGWRAESSASIRRDVFSHKEKKAFAKRGKWEHLITFVRG
ncbi:MAG: hypothetical protein V3S29_09415 [bacterium]